jgi:hypothetical protein
LNKKLVPAICTGWNDPEQKGWLKFWILTDGTVVPIEETHMEIGDSSGEPYWDDLLSSGAISGNLHGSELGIRMQKELTPSQIFKLKQIYLEYHPDMLGVDIRKTVDGIDKIFRGFRERIDSLDHFEYLLTYGKIEKLPGFKPKSLTSIFHEMKTRR